MGVDWKGLLGKAAPFIAKALTGGIPSAAAGALAAASRALLGRGDGTQDEVAAALAGATPEQLERLRQAEHEFTLKLAELAVSLERVEADDRANARAREIALRDRMPAVLAIVLTAGMFGSIAMLAFVQIPQQSREPLLLLVGSLSTAWGAAMAFYHGSSSSSRAKDAVLGKMAGR